MCGIYTYYTIKSNLVVNINAFDALKLTTAYIGGCYSPTVVVLAETEWQWGFSDWDTVVEDDMKKISEIAISGELEVIREGENIFDCPPIKYIITPGHVEKLVAKISYYSTQKE